MPAVLALAALIAQTSSDFVSITPEAILAHLKYLASDELEGRATPSAGLDKAAGYIAAQFKKAGLIPPSEAPGFDKSATGIDGYFQSSEFENRRTKQTGTVRNVIGVVPGTDEKLKNSYVLITAHYDHLGKREGEGDTIYNGANDDGSGVVGVIECARALMGKKPKRSIVFMCFWGEELGMRGSSYYVHHPVFSLKDTDVDLNIEQIGRTDDSEGPRVSEYNVTGFDLDDLAGTLSTASKPFGVKVTMHPKLSTPYFYASDNISFASAGVPANTVSTSYEFPDYHGVGDEWQKIDAKNMALIVRSLCSGLWSLANADQPVRWNEDNENAKQFVEKWKAMRGG